MTRREKQKERNAFHNSFFASCRLGRKWEGRLRNLRGDCLRCSSLRGYQQDHKGLVEVAAILTESAVSTPQSACPTGHGPAGSLRRNRRNAFMSPAESVTQRASSG